MISEKNKLNFNNNSGKAGNELEKNKTQKNAIKLDYAIVVPLSREKDLFEIELYDWKSAARLISNPATGWKFNCSILVC